MQAHRKTALKIITLASITSTNDYAAALARNDEPEITVVRAHHQTAGKGRLGRLWASPPKSGVYASFIVRPQNPLHELIYLPLLGALAVARVIGKYLPLTIKLPNDIMARGKKISGILVEAQGGYEHVAFAIVGIGINVNARADEFAGINATSIYLETGNEERVDLIFKRLTGEFVSIYRDFTHGLLTRLLTETYRYQERKSLKRLEAAFRGPEAFEEVIRFI